MFYSVELLSHRRRSKLARCWLAATVSEKLFKRTCKPLFIKQINVSVICEEILSAIEIRGGRSYSRFSLYLSSQLMYGATKILFYQTKYFEDYLFEINSKLLEINRSRDEFNSTTALEIPEVPSVIQVFRDAKVSSDLHLIRDEPYINVVKHTMQDEMNFGVLSSLEMEQFMLLGVEELSLNDIRKCRWDETEEILEECVQIPLVDINELENETVDIETETRAAIAKKDQKESLITIEDQQVRKSTFSTPKKRTLKSPMETTETPTKKSKISSEEALEPQLLPLLLPTVLPEVPEQVLAPIEPEYELQQPLVAENEELIEVRKQRRRRKLFDKQNTLTADKMRKFIADVRAHTIQQSWFTITLPSANEYLMQPSTKISNKSWGNTLFNLFNTYLTGPFIAEDEFLNKSDFEVEQLIHGETIREDITSKPHDQISELSSKLPIHAMEMTDQLSRTIEKMSLIEDFGQEEFEKHKKLEIEESSVLLPDIKSFEKKTKVPVEISDKHDSDERELKNASKSSSSSCSKACLTKIELLTLLEVYWKQSKLVKFHDIIPPEYYNKIDASCAFQYCLEFHTEKIIILKQAECFDTIWIEKYPTYSSESDNDAT